MIYGALLNDVILRVAEQGCFDPYWSEDVLVELHRNLVEVADISDVSARGRISAMAEAFPTAAVTGYEPLIPSMTCDPKDRHVLAAAVTGRCEVLVTFNTDDFPDASFSAFGLGVVHPDPFLLDQLDLHPVGVQRALLGFCVEAARPPMTVEDLAAGLERAGVPRFAAAVRVEVGSG